MKSTIIASVAVILAICATGALGNGLWGDDGLDDLYENGYGRGGYYGGASVYPSYGYGVQGYGQGIKGYGHGGVNTVIRQPYPYPVPAAGGLGFGAGYAVGNNNNGGGLFGGDNGCK